MKKWNRAALDLSVLKLIRNGHGNNRTIRKALGKTATHNERRAAPSLRRLMQAGLIERVERDHYVITE